MTPDCSVTNNVVEVSKLKGDVIMICIEIILPWFSNWCHSLTDRCPTPQQ
jgi:hypothetical protein